MRTLQIVYLFENNINETIPYEIGILSSLNELALFKNNLTGSIPASIGSLGNLSTLLLNNNGLFWNNTPRNRNAKISKRA